ncbi:hypothetical protein AB6D20_027825 (plasmid) [Vibrio splendidus]
MRNSNAIDELLMSCTCATATAHALRLHGRIFDDVAGFLMMTIPVLDHSSACGENIAGKILQGGEGGVAAAQAIGRGASHELPTNYQLAGMIGGDDQQYQPTVPTPASLRRARVSAASSTGNMDFHR